MKMKLFFWVLALGVFFVACDKNNDTDLTTEVDNTISEEFINDAIEMGTVSLEAYVKDVLEVISNTIKQGLL